MNWWFGDWYPRCDFPDGIVSTRFIFLGTNKLIRNRRVFFCCCGNGSAASFTSSVDPVSLIFLIKLWIDMREHSKLGWSFQIFYAFQTFSLKSLSFLFVGENHLVAFVWIEELRNAWAKTSDFNQLWFALQWYLALPRLLYKAKKRKKQINPGQF